MISGWNFFTIYIVEERGKVISNWGVKLDTNILDGLGKYSNFWFQSDLAENEDKLGYYRKSDFKKPDLKLRNMS